MFALRPTHGMSEWILSENAAEDLIEIYVYSYQEFGERQAEAYTREIEAKFSMLADSPTIGTVLAEIPGDYRRSVFRSHVIVYRTATSSSTERTGGVFSLSVSCTAVGT